MSVRADSPYALRRPLVGLAIIVILGTAAGTWIQLPRPTLFGLVLVALVLVALVLRRKPVTTSLVHLCLFGAAWLSASLRLQEVASDHIDVLMEREAEFLEVEGTLASPPQHDESEYRGATWRAVLKIEKVRRVSDWEPASGRIQIYWPDAALGSPPSYGDRWLFKGPVKTVGEKRILYADPVASHLQKQNQGSRVIGWAMKRREASARVLEKGLADFPDEAGVLKALLLGYREDLPQEHYTLFAATGTLHVFAISGLHVAVYGLIVIMFLKMFGMTRPNWILVVAPLLILYTIMTGMKISAIRACLMAIVFGSSFLFQRRPDGLSSVSLAAIIVLAFMPAQLTDPGFLFSFCVVVGLIVFCAPIFRPLSEKLQPDPFSITPDPPWKTALRKVGFWFLGLVVTSFVAWLFSAPLTAAFFNRFSPIALLGNLVVIPAAFVIVLTGCLSLLTSLIHPVLPEVFNHANRLFITVLVDFIDLLAKTPGGHRYVPSPGTFYIAVWYVALFAGLLLRRKRRIITVGLACATFVFGAYRSATDQTVTIDILDVGYGNAVFVNLPGGKDMMIDTGPRYTVRRVVRHLRAQGVNELETVVLTHADTAHIGGTLELLEQIPIREFWIPPGLDRSRYYTNLFALAASRGIKVVEITRGQTGTLPGGLQWEALHPPEQVDSRKANNHSLVLRLARNADSILLMGGAGAEVEKGILANPIEPAAQILLTGNHGEAESASEEWLKLVSPEQVIISTGRNRYSHPARDVLERLEGKKISAWRTDRRGGLRVIFLKKPRSQRIQAIPLDSG